MRYFLTLLVLRLRTALQSAGFWLTCGIILAGAVLLAEVLPQGTTAGVSVGIYSQDQPFNQLSELLADNEDFDFVAYTDPTEVEREVLSGNLHCAYLFAQQTPPITVLETKSSYLRPLVDEIVLSAYLQLQTPMMVSEYLEQAGLPASAVEEDYARIQKETTPMTIQLKTAGNVPKIEQLAQSSVQPLLYALLATAFPIAALVSVLLAGERRAAEQRYLATFSGRPILTLLAPVFADALLYSALLIAADLLMNRLVIHPVYGVQARLIALLVLAIISALFQLTGALIKRFGDAVSYTLPLFAVVSVFCSGALINPLYLPVGLGALRFLSPAWYFLRLVGALS